MVFRNFVVSLGLAACAALLSACASEPATTSSTAPTAAPAPAAAPAKTEADTAEGLEKKFQDAARSYKVVQKDGKTMYCKREKVMGSTIPTLQCITEAQLRNQVETTDELKNRMRNRAGGCVQTGGCTGGG
jgi:hypothetical protein